MRKLPMVSRRKFFALASASALSVSNSRELFAEAFEMAADKTASPVNPDQALRDLLDGNKRFMKGQTTGPRRSPADFQKLAAGQYPEAIIVSCARSRACTSSDCFLCNCVSTCCKLSSEMVKTTVMGWS